MTHTLVTFIAGITWLLSSTNVLALQNDGDPQKTRNDLAELGWEATDIDFQFFNSNVTTRLCNQDEASFLACVASIQAVLQRNPRELELVHESWQAANAVRQSVRMSFGSAHIVRYKNKRKETLAETLRRIRASRTRILKWRNLYRSGLSNPVDFSGIRNWILSAVVDYDNKASYAAAAINGYLSASDPHAQILPARLLYGNAQQESNRYSGVGVSLQKLGKKIYVGNVIKNGPAYKAGLRPNDQIHSVDSELVTGKGVHTVATNLRGPKRSGVVLKVKRDGELHRFIVIRDEVEIKNVSYEIITDRGQPWGYLRIQTFAAGNTCHQVRRALNKLKASKIKGLVLDLRNNMGGLVVQAACVADLFLQPKLVVLEMRGVNGSNNNDTIKTRAKVFVNTPMVTLVNASSGSASEILAGALQDHQRSLIVGERTFGKGSIQVTRPWASSSSILHMYTTALYYLPSGRTVQFIGVAPDLKVFQTPTMRERDVLALRESDLFPTALSAVDSGWVQPRASQVAKVARCTQRMGLAEHRMTRNEGAKNNFDYPLSYAQDALICMYVNQIR